MVDKLNRNLRTLVMHPVGQLAEPREIPVVGDRHLMRRSGSARVGDCTHFSDQESGAAAGPPLDKTKGQWTANTSSRS